MAALIRHTNTAFMIAALGVAALAAFIGVTEWMWDVSWWSLVFVMAIRPLADLLPQVPVLRQLVIWRKGLGILSATVVVVAVAIRATPDPVSFFITYADPVSWQLAGAAMAARYSELTGFILLITSNTFSQRLLGVWWKRVQRLAYIYFVSGGIFLISINKMEALWSMLVVVGLMIAASVVKKRRAAQAA